MCSSKTASGRHVIESSSTRTPGVNFHITVTIPSSGKSSEIPEKIKISRGYLENRLKKNSIEIRSI